MVWRVTGQEVLDKPLDLVCEGVEVREGTAPSPCEQGSNEG